jgi:hypothetical protein
MPLCTAATQAGALDDAAKAGLAGEMVSRSRAMEMGRIMTEVAAR